MLFLLASSDTFAQETLDADLVVGMTASPTTGLVTGEFVDIWITVTNKGPARVDGLSLESSTFFDEFGQFHDDPAECFLYATVADAVPRPYYYINWPVAVPGETAYPPLLAGETRACHFQLSLSAHASDVTPFRFEVPSYFVDIDPTNDGQTVYLRRAPKPVPLTSTTSLWLAVLFAATAMFALCARPRCDSMSARARKRKF